MKMNSGVIGESYFDNYYRSKFEGINMTLC